MEYTTQMDAARKGIQTKELLRVAEKEHMDPAKINGSGSQRTGNYSCNKLHTCIDPSGIGKDLSTKINVNLGTSRDWTDLDMEMEKVKSAVDMGAEAIMDLSSFGDTEIQKEINK